VFVEIDGMCLKTIEKNLQNLQFKERAVVLKADVFSGLEWLIHHSNYQGYDIIFFGPPYRDEKNIACEWTSRILKLVAESNIMAKNGLIAAQHHVREKVFIPEKLTLIRRTKYGDTFLSFLKNRDTSHLL
jgi:16S rRNA G966 N2-methylase RsmD